MYPPASIYRRLAPPLLGIALLYPLHLHAAPEASHAPLAKFAINEFRVLGNHVLPQTAVESAVYPFLGDNGDMDAVKKAADALQNAYKDAGFGTVFVDIPEQTVEEGIVRLRVTEGKLDHVHVRGERYFSDRQILAGLPSLKQNETPHLPTLQEELTALNSRTGDRSITPVLKAGQKLGTVDVDLAVQDSSPLHGFVQVDNRRTADTTPTRATGSLSYGNLWQRQDTLSLVYQTAPANTKNAEVYSATYLGHAGYSGLFALSYVHTSSNVAALDTLGVLGKGSIYGAHWLQPIINTQATSQSVNFGVDYKDVNTIVIPHSSAVSGGTDVSAAAVSAPIRYLNWSGSYSGVWRGTQGSLASTLGVGFGLRSVVNSQSEFDNARYRGDPGYFYIRVSGDALRALPHGLAVRARWAGQWTDSALVNNEQFAIGGIDTVRGYLEAESLGDSGVAGSLELHSTFLGDRAWKTLSHLYVFGFVDGGISSLADPLPLQQYHTRLWSTGIGLRLENSSGFSGDFDYAIPRVPGSRTRDDEGHVDFSIKYEF